MSKILAELGHFFFSSPNIYIFIISGLTLFIFLRKPVESTKIQQDTHQIDSINVRIDTLTKRMNQIDPKIDSAKRSIDTVKQIIRSNDLNIKNIQAKSAKTDSIIHSYSPDQLQQYFSDY